MLIPFFVKDGSKTLVACSLHADSQLDLAAWKEIILVMGRIAREQLGDKQLAVAVTTNGGINA